MSEQIELVTIHDFGSQQNKRTNWMRWSGFRRADLSNGTTRWFPEGTLTEDILKYLRLGDKHRPGVSTAAFDKTSAEARKKYEYPPKPESEVYYHNYGYEKPIKLGGWSWSTTFGRWGRLVTFADGWYGFTYPKNY